MGYLEKVLHDMNGILPHPKPVVFKSLKITGLAREQFVSRFLFIGPPTKEGLDLEIQSRSFVRPSGPA